jgi:HEAT repeat protein
MNRLRGIFLFSAAMAMGNAALFAEEKPRVAIAAFGGADGTAGAVREAVREQLKPVAELVEADDPALALGEPKQVLQLAKRAGASYALLLKVEAAGRATLVQLRFFGLPGPVELLAEQYRNADPAKIAAEIARDVRPFLTGVSAAKLPEIIASLSSGTDDRVAMAKAELRAVQGEALALALLEAFSEAENEVVRLALAEKLAGLGDPAAVPELRNALSGSKGEEGEATAESGFRCRLGTPFCRLAGKVRDRASASIIAKLLAQEQQRAASLQQTAIAAERKLGADMVTLTAEERARAQKQADYYSGLVADSKAFQAAAIEALGSIGVPETASVLLSTVLIDEYSDAARRALVEMGPAASKTLLESLSDERLSANCARLLGEIQDKATVEPLLRGLVGADPFIRQLIIEALGKIGDARAVEPLRGYLDDPYLRLPAIQALGRLKDAGTVPRLAKLLASPQSREAAAEALGRIASQEALAALQALLAGKPSTEDQLLVLRSLGKSGRREVVGELMKGMNGKETREAAIRAVCEIGQEAEPALLDALSSADWETRRNAIFLLGRVGAEAAKPKLLEAAKGPDADLAFIAASALRKLQERLEQARSENE